MVRFGRSEGLRLRDIYYVAGRRGRATSRWTLSPRRHGDLAQPPGTLLAQALWGDAVYPNPMLFQPLPLLAVYPLFLLMPTTHALRRAADVLGIRRAAAARLRDEPVGSSSRIVGAVLSVQHMFFSFQLDWRYDLWLAVKFLPFALWTGFIVDRRPTTLPYLMGGHFLLDSLLPVLVLMVSRGVPLS